MKNAPRPSPSLKIRADIAVREDVTISQISEVLAQVTKLLDTLAHGPGSSVMVSMPKGIRSA